MIGTAIKIMQGFIVLATVGIFFYGVCRVLETIQGA